MTIQNTDEATAADNPFPPHYRQHALWERARIAREQAVRDDDVIAAREALRVHGVHLPE